MQELLQYEKCSSNKRDNFKNPNQSKLFKPTILLSSIYILSFDYYILSDKMAIL
ncbi:hypothetical protein GGU45_000510 [Niabella hirudinis]